MQCPACRAVYSNALELCPRCKTPAANIPEPRAIEESAPPAALPQVQASAPKQSSDDAARTGDSSITAHIQTEKKAAGGANVKTAASTKPASTLIEFPGAGRAARPQWRKDLSDRVREIQERRAREATHESRESFIETTPAPQNSRPLNLSPDANGTASPETASPEKTSSTLGLVPSSADAAPINPLVVAALRRIERARQSATPPPNTQARARSSMSNAATATAVARVREEHYQQEADVQPSAAVQLPEHAPLAAVANPAESGQSADTAAPARNLVVVPAHSITQEAKESTEATPPLPRRIITQVIDDALLARLDAPQEEIVHHAAFDKERAPVQARLTGGVADALVVLFASTPFAAIIELTNGNWTDLRVVASMIAIAALVMFLYLTASTALAGRTWGMSLVSLRAVDVNNGELPTTKQSVMRAAAYMLSLAACGLGLFYALWDAEGRAAHDHLSGTVVVRD